MGPRNRVITTHPCRAQDLGGPAGLLKSIEILQLCQDPSKPPKCRPRYPKTFQNESPKPPKLSQIPTLSKTEKPSKTIVFTVYTAHASPRLRSHFRSQAAHKHPSNSYRQLSDPNHEKVTPMSSKWDPKGTPNPLKIC